MVWNETFPNGDISVEDNGPIGRENTAYLQTTARINHYFNEGATLDGHHKPIHQKNVDADPTPVTGMNGVSYVKNTDGDRPAQFFNNSQAIVQTSPTHLSGNITFKAANQYLSLSDSLFKPILFPNDIYGKVFLFRGDKQYAAAFGDFFVQANSCEAFVSTTFLSGKFEPTAYLIFGNGDTRSSRYLRVAAGYTGTLNVVFRWKVFYWKF